MANVGTDTLIDPAPSNTPDLTHLRRTRRLMDRARRYWDGLDHTGTVVALLFGVQSLAPSLLPRHWVVQGLVTGLGLIGGYGIGVAIAAILRLFRVPAPPPRVRSWIWRILGSLAGLLFALALWLSSGWQAEIREAVGIDDDPRHHYVLVLILSVVIAMVLRAVAQGIRELWRLLDGLIRRLLPPPLSGAIAALLVAAIVVGISTDIIGAGARKMAEVSFAAADELTDPDIRQPMSAARSGSPSSHVEWDSLGRDGRTFVASGPTANDISTLTGRPAQEPIRVYVGRESASTPEEQAALVVAELRRTHADRRKVIAVAGTTGRGWIPPSSTTPLEYIMDGNTAIAAMQYSYFPSWISFLVDRTVSENSGSALFDAVHEYWASLPAATRPKLVVFGTSLGAFATMSAFSDLNDLLTRTDAALFIGPPHSTTLWRKIVASRRPGTREVLPLIGDGGAVRFFGRASDLRNPDGTLVHPQVAIAQHGSDPIVWWSPSLIWQRPDWLRERRAPDVIPRITWFPWVPFWQLTTDQMVSMDAPPGAGHDYGPELITGWLALLRPPAWTAADTARLTRVVRDTQVPVSPGTH